MEQVIDSYKNMMKLKWILFSVMKETQNTLHWMIPSAWYSRRKKLLAENRYIWEWRVKYKEATQGFS